MLRCYLQVALNPVSLASVCGSLPYHGRRSCKYGDMINHPAICWRLSKTGFCGASTRMDLLSQPERRRLKSDVMNLILVTSVVHTLLKDKAGPDTRFARRYRYYQPVAAARRWLITTLSPLFLHLSCTGISVNGFAAENNTVQIKVKRFINAALFDACCQSPWKPALLRARVIISF